MYGWRKCDVNTYNRTLSLIKGDIAICDNTDKPRGYYAKRNKPDTEKMYTISLKCRIKNKNKK
jgi:hypothetical protein